MFDLTAYMTCSKHRQQCRAAGAVASPLTAGYGHCEKVLFGASEHSKLVRDDMCIAQ